MAGKSAQFRAVGWYMDSQANWSIAPPLGTISASGLYAAPAMPPAGDTSLTVTATSRSDPAKRATATLTLLSRTPEIRIRCGAPPGFKDAQGRVWSADYGFGPADASKTSEQGVHIEGVSPDMEPLYRSCRYGPEDEDFHYKFALPNGTYQVTLKFAESAEEPGHHKFDVSINRTHVLRKFDPAQAARGGRRAIDRSFAVTVSKKVLQIDFIGHEGGAFINGIEIVPQAAAPTGK